jgi:hypothetical protein
LSISFQGNAVAYQYRTVIMFKEESSQQLFLSQIVVGRTELLAVFGGGKTRRVLKHIVYVDNAPSARYRSDDG